MSSVSGLRSSIPATASPLTFVDTVMSFKEGLQIVGPLPPCWPYMACRLSYIVPRTVVPPPALPPVLLLPVLLLLTPTSARAAPAGTSITIFTVAPQVDFAPASPEAAAAAISNRCCAFALLLLDSGVAGKDTDGAGVQVTLALAATGAHEEGTWVANSPWTDSSRLASEQLACEGCGQSGRLLIY